MLKQILNLIFLIILLNSSLNIIYCQYDPRQDQYPDSTVYMLTYDHGGLILWGSDHFRERLANSWIRDNSERISERVSGSIPLVISGGNAIKSCMML